jgi:predicted RNase H-like HicB family nuclease
MSMKFTVKIFKGEKYYIARVPELGVTTQGKTKEEAKKNLREALQLHLEAITEYAIEHGRVEIEKAKLVTAQEY